MHINALSVFACGIREPIKWPGHAAWAPNSIPKIWPYISSFILGFVEFVSALSRLTFEWENRRNNDSIGRHNFIKQKITAKKIDFIRIHCRSTASKNHRIKKKHFSSSCGSWCWQYRYIQGKAASQITRICKQKRIAMLNGARRNITRKPSIFD